MHYILSQDLLFIMFSLLPLLSVLPVEERNMLFKAHISVICIHSTYGLYMLIFEVNQLEMRYYIGILILTSVGYLFVFLLGFTMYYGGFGNNFSLLFEEDDEIIRVVQEQRNQHNVMDSNFYDAFDKIHTVIYEPYLVLKNKTCPICLIEYKKNDAIKIMPN